jgi:hypothetical protein
MQCEENTLWKETAFSIENSPGQINQDDREWLVRKSLLNTLLDDGEVRFLITQNKPFRVKFESEALVGGKIMRASIIM